MKRKNIRWMIHKTNQFRLKINHANIGRNQFNVSFPRFNQNHAKKQYFPIIYLFIYSFAKQIQKTKLPAKTEQFVQNLNTSSFLFPIGGKCVCLRVCSFFCARFIFSFAFYFRPVFCFSLKCPIFASA